MSDEKQTPEEEQRAAADQRLRVLIEALDADPDDDRSMRELFTARRRLSEHLARVIAARPDLSSRVHGYVPEPEDDGPATAEEAMLWTLGATYEQTAGLLRVFVGEDRIHELPIATLRQNAAEN
jgi:hypothetical protein